MTVAERATKQRIFLEIFREQGNVKASCKAAGVARRTFYSWRKVDDAFKVQLEDAQEEAADTLETEAWERATGEGGKRPSDTLLIFLLNGLRPDKYVRRVHHSGKVESGARVVVTIPDNGRDPEMLPKPEPDTEKKSKTVH